MLICTCSPSQDENSLLPDQGRSLPFWDCGQKSLGFGGDLAAYYQLLNVMLRKYRLLNRLVSVIQRFPRVEVPYYSKRGRSFHFRNERFFLYFSCNMDLILIAIYFLIWSRKGEKREMRKFFSLMSRKTKGVVVGPFRKPSRGRSNSPIHSISLSLPQLLERSVINYYSIIRGAWAPCLSFLVHHGK